MTFTPRLLSVDLKGALGYLSEQGDLYSDETQPNPDETCLWNPKNLEVTKEKQVPKSPFIKSLEDKAQNEDNNTSFNLENQVDSWVDYLVPRFHPRTINIIKDYSHKNQDKQFNIFNYGKTLWQSEQFQDDFSDRIRAYAEECDSLQGFQVINNFISSNKNARKLILYKKKL